MYASSFALKFDGGQGNMLILLDVSSRVYHTYNSAMRDFRGGISCRLYTKQSVVHVFALASH